MARQTRRLEQIDADTGEIIEGGVLVYVGAKTHWRESFFMGIQAAFERLATDERLTLEARRVFDVMLARLSYENNIYLPGVEIAEVLGVTPQQVSRGTRLLVEQGYIIRGPKLGRTHTYRLNSEIAWKGKVRNLAKQRPVDLHAARLAREHGLEVIEGGGGDRDTDTLPLWGDE